jgi:mono/diheme cytochrome c family protein
MKKVVVTSVLCFQFACYLFAQAKKQSASQTSANRGKQVFETTCITCHQKDGGGVPHLNPPLIKTEYVLGDKSRLIQIVLKGLNKPIEIEDETYTNVMPAQSQLNDQQIADVLTYVRNNFGNKASAITAAQVKAERAKAQ